MKTDMKEISSQTIKKWGIVAQLWMVVEECAELTNAISKFERGRVNELSVIEELADVSIMVDQMSFYFGKTEFESIREVKLQRLLDRLQDIK